ncbi:MAG: hypothetical protein ACKVT1_03955 [Dehalococcoidia bacterium]
MVLSASCGDEGPKGYSVADLKRLPEASLFVPDGEKVREVGDKGGTFSGPNDTGLTIIVSTSLDPEAVFTFYRSELTDRGWAFDRSGGVLQGSLLEAQGRQRDFQLFLKVLDPKLQYQGGLTAWTEPVTRYALTIVAVGEKGE